MTEYVFLRNKDKCGLPDVERVPTDPVIVDCVIPPAPPPILEPFDPDLPPLPELPDCADIEITGAVSLLPAGSLPTLTITGGLTEVGDCPQKACPFVFNFDFELPEFQGLPGDPGPCPLLDATSTVTTQQGATPDIQVQVIKPDPSQCAYLFQFDVTFPDLSNLGSSVLKRVKLSTRLPMCGEGLAHIMGEASGQDCDCSQLPGEVPIEDKSGLASQMYSVDDDEWYAPAESTGHAKFNECSGKYELVSIGKGCCPPGTPLGEHIYVKTIERLPGRINEVPGTGEVELWALDEDGNLVNTGNTLEVFNIGEELQQQSFFIGHRDATGRYGIDSNYRNDWVTILIRNASTVVMPAWSIGFLVDLVDPAPAPGTNIDPPPGLLDRLFKVGFDNTSDIAVVATRDIDPGDIAVGVIKGDVPGRISLSPPSEDYIPARVSPKPVAAAFTRDWEEIDTVKGGKFGGMYGQVSHGTIVDESNAWGLISINNPGEAIIRGSAVDGTAGLGLIWDIPPDGVIPDISSWLGDTLALPYLLKAVSVQLGTFSAGWGFEALRRVEGELHLSLEFDLGVTQGTQVDPAFDFYAHDPVEISAHLLVRNANGTTTATQLDSWYEASVIQGQVLSRGKRIAGYLLRLSLIPGTKFAIGFKGPDIYVQPIVRVLSVEFYSGQADTRPSVFHSP